MLMLLMAQIGRLNVGIISLTLMVSSFLSLPFLLFVLLTLTKKISSLVR